MIGQFIPDLVRDFFAPLFTLLGGMALLGGGTALALAAVAPALLAPFPFLAPLALVIGNYARKAAALLLAGYAVFAIGLFMGRREVRAEWKLANETAAIAYAERDADNFLKTRADADALEAQIEQERQARKDAQDALRKSIGPGNSRFTRDDIERLRDHDRNTSPSRKPLR